MTFRFVCPNQRGCNSPNSSYGRSLSRLSGNNSSNSSQESFSHSSSSLPTRLTKVYKTSSSPSMKLSPFLRRSSSSLCFQDLSSTSSLTSYENLNQQQVQQDRPQEEGGNETEEKSIHRNFSVSRSINVASDKSLKRDVDKKNLSSSDKILTNSRFTNLAGFIVPTWLQNSLVILGLFYQSFAFLALICFLESTFVKLNRKFNMMTALQNMLPKFRLTWCMSRENFDHQNRESRESIDHWFWNHLSKKENLKMKEFDNNSDNNYRLSNSVSSNMKKSTSDEWGHFTDVDESVFFNEVLHHQNQSPVLRSMFGFSFTPANKKSSSMNHVYSNSSDTINLDTLHELAEDEDD